MNEGCGGKKEEMKGRSGVNSLWIRLEDKALNLGIIGLIMFE